MTKYKNPAWCHYIVENIFEKLNIINEYHNLTIKEIKTKFIHELICKYDEDGDRIDSGIMQQLITYNCKKCNEVVDDHYLYDDGYETDLWCMNCILGPDD